jgi:lipopolysaccharide transport system ATP-binding protein
MKTTIQARGLGKTYPVNGKPFWALKDLDLDVKEGQAMGIIGGNGAGKSTLLKLLSGISHPSEGGYRLEGQMTSLLEIGTGFHPDLSGRENIYLSAALHGMDRQTTTQRLDAIVDFSGVEAFLDTAIKHYSSGMKVRLGFALAAHMDADMLLVDEVLAVGDAAFHAKCLRRMESQMQNAGRTVLFVSHNMLAMQSLCDQAIWLQQGKVHQLGESHAVASAYLQQQLPLSHAIDLTEHRDRSGHGDVRITAMSWDRAPRSGQSASLRIQYNGKAAMEQPNLRLSLEGADGRFLAPISMHTSNIRPDRLKASGKLVVHFDALPCMAGTYQIRARLLCKGLIQDDLRPAMRFEVQEGLITPGGDSFSLTKNGVFLPLTWDLEQALDSGNALR